MTVGATRKARLHSYPQHGTIFIIINLKFHQECNDALAAGRPVTSVALDLGYGNVSAFIALFKRSFGVTPGRYYNATQAVQPVTAGSEKPE